MRGVIRFGDGEGVPVEASIDRKGDVIRLRADTWSVLFRLEPAEARKLARWLLADAVEREAAAKGGG
jgi:hypothetical protein